MAVVLICVVAVAALMGGGSPTEDVQSAQTNTPAPWVAFCNVSDQIRATTAHPPATTPGQGAPPTFDVTGPYAQLVGLVPDPTVKAALQTATPLLTSPLAASSGQATPSKLAAVAAVNQAMKANCGYGTEIFGLSRRLPDDRLTETRCNCAAEEYVGDPRPHPVAIRSNRDPHERTRRLDDATAGDGPLTARAARPTWESA